MNVNSKSNLHNNLGIKRQSIIKTLFIWGNNGLKEKKLKQDLS